MKKILLIVTMTIITGCTPVEIPTIEFNGGKRIEASDLVRKVPLTVKMGALGASIDVDMKALTGVVLDAKRLLELIQEQGPSESPVEGPQLVIYNKHNNKVTYFKLTDRVKEVRLRSTDTKGVELVIKNKTPLEIELWVDTSNDIELDVEFNNTELSE